MGPITDEWARMMYAGGRGNCTARRFARFPGGRPHIPVPVGAPVEEFARIAARHPVFSLRPRAA